jgi:hypothetical protein
MSVQKFLEDICTAFPEIRPLMDKHDEYMTTSKMEAFGEATTLAFSRNGDPKKGAAYLNFMSKRLNNATPEEAKYIDTYYTEVLFHESSEKAISIGWPLVPQNLKDLYIKFHGYQPGELKKIRKHR